ncbi:hypothetical protein Tco_0280778 [Tanacetum coccineum]
MAPMDFSDSEVYTDKTCSKTCLKNYETLKKQCDDLIVKLNQTEFIAATYKRGLATVEAQLIAYRKNEVLLVKKLQFFKEPDSKVMVLRIVCNETNVVCDKESDNSKENSDESLVEEQVSQDKSSFVESSPNVDKETVFPVNKKVEFTKPKNHEKRVKKSIRYAEMYRSQSPRGNQTNWNGQKSNQLRKDFVMYKKACFICGSFNHLQINCDNHQRRGIVSRNNYNRVDAKTTHPSVLRNMSPKAVLLKTGLTPLNMLAPLRLLTQKQTFHMSNKGHKFSKQAQSTAKRPFYKQTALTRRYVHAGKPQHDDNGLILLGFLLKNYYCQAKVNAVEMTWAPKLVMRLSLRSSGDITGKGLHYMLLAKKQSRTMVITGLLKLMLLSIQFLLLVYFTAAKLMLGSVNAVRHMLMFPKFAETYNVVAFLEKPVESNGFPEIIDFLKESFVHYALTVNPIIYTSCIEQFWTTAKSSIRRDLHLDDAEGTDCLPTATIFEDLARMGITPLFATMMVQVSEEVGADSGHPTDSTQVPILDQPSTPFKPKKKQTSKKTQRQEAEVPQDETEHKESVPTPSNDPQPSGEDSMQLTDLMVLCTKLQTQVLDLQKAKDAQANEIAALKKRIQKLEKKKMSRPTGLKRLKKGRSIADIDADVEVTLVDETQERQDDELIFDTGVLDTDEIPVEAKVDEKDEQSSKLDDSTAGEAFTSASVEDSAAPTTIEKITLAQTLIQIKAAKPKVVTTAATTTTTIRPKAKGVVVQEPKVPLKRKDQIALDEQIARDIQAKLDAEIIEEQKLAKKQEEEANIALIESWENTQAMMEADRLLAERLQSKERQELTDKEKGKLFMELMEKRRKHFTALRA